MAPLFISDLHFGHGNVLKFEDRSFANSVEEMDEELLRRFNAKGNPGDLVYVLGDLFWHNRDGYALNILKRMNKQIYLIKGNHDKFLHDSAVRNYLAGVEDYKDIPVTLADGTKKRVVLSHYFIPQYNGHRYGAIHLHGHSHNSFESELERKMADMLRAEGMAIESYNVGACHQNFEPMYLDEILQKGRKD
jgi:calcineurin-like phosphoesterase family protein